MATVLPAEFKEFIRLLNEHNVVFLIVGGYAVSYHGYPRYTGDIDILVQPSLENGRKVMAALAAFGFSVDISEAFFTQENGVLRLGNPPLRIDLLTGIAGVTFDECYREMVVTVIDGIRVPVIGLSHLKRNKTAAGRAKDLADLENL